MIEGVYGFFASLGYTEPLHPPLAHMPIGLVVGALAFGLTALFLGRASLWRCTWNCLFLAEVFVVLTAVAGVMDWQYFLSGTWVFPIEVKMVLAGGLFCLLLVGLFAGRKAAGPPASFVAVLILSFLSVVSLGYFGGKLVYAAKPERPVQESASGENFYSSLCEKCHPGGGNVVEPDHPLVGSDRLKTFKSFLEWIRDPDPPMPAFPSSKISDQDARLLYDYIVNLLVKQSPSR